MDSKANLVSPDSRKDREDLEDREATSNRWALAVVTINKEDLALAEAGAEEGDDGDFKNATVI